MFQNASYSGSSQQPVTYILHPRRVPRRFEYCTRYVFQQPHLPQHRASDSFAASICTPRGFRLALSSKKTCITNMVPYLLIDRSP